MQVASILNNGNSMLRFDLPKRTSLYGKSSVKIFVYLFLVESCFSLIKLLPYNFYFIVTNYFILINYTLL